MQPDLTLVIPTKDSQRTILRCLKSISEQRDCNVEAIVVDNFSQDRTAELAASVTDQIFLAGPERSTQRNIGLAKANGRNIGFIDSDMILTPHVCRQAVEQLEQLGKGGVIIPELSIGEGYLADCRALEKRMYLGNRDVEAARVFPTKLVRSIGGYDESLIAGEDWDLADRIEAKGLKIGRTQAVIHHDDGHVSLKGMFSKKRYYGRSFADYLENREPGRGRSLARPALLKQSGLMLRNPRLAAGLVLLKSIEASGLYYGIREGRKEMARS